MSHAEEPSADLRVATRVEKNETIPSFIFAFQNKGKEGCVLHLGWILPEKKLFIPSSLAIRIAEQGAEPEEFIHQGLPRVAGRMDPYLVALPAGASYEIKVSADSFLHHKTLQQMTMVANSTYHGNGILRPPAEVSTTDIPVIWNKLILSEPFVFTMDL